MRSRWSVAGNSTVTLTGLLSVMERSFSFVMSASVLFEHEITRDDHTDREAGPDGKRRRHVKLPADDFLTGIVDRVLAAVADGAQQAVVVVDRELGADAEKRGEARGLGEVPPVIVDAILEARIARRVRARLALQDDRAAVGEDQPIPHQQHAALAELHGVVVLADDAGALRHEEYPPGR